MASQQQINQPWGPSQEYLKTITQTLLDQLREGNTAERFSGYTGDLYAPMNSRQNYGILSRTARFFMTEWLQ